MDLESKIINKSSHFETAERFARTHKKDCGPLPVLVVDDLLFDIANQRTSFFKILPKVFHTPEYRIWPNDNVFLISINKVTSFEEGLLINDIVSRLVSNIEVVSILRQPSIGRTFDCKNESFSLEHIQEACNLVLENFGYPTDLLIGEAILNKFIYDSTPRMKLKLPIELGFDCKSPGVIKSILTPAGMVNVSPLESCNRVFLINPEYLDYHFRCPSFVVQTDECALGVAEGYLHVHDHNKIIEFVNIGG